MVSIGFSLLSYKVVTSIFRYYDISHYLYLKVSLFLISILVAYIVYQGILIKSRKEISSRLSQEKKKFKIVFQNNKKKTIPCLSISHFTYNCFLYLYGTR